MKNLFIYLMVFFSAHAMCDEFVASLEEKNEYKSLLDKKYTSVCDEYMEYLKENSEINFCGDLIGNFRNIKAYEWTNLSHDDARSLKKEAIDIKYKNLTAIDKENKLNDATKNTLEHSTSNFDYDNDGKLENVLKTKGISTTCNKFPTYDPPVFSYRLLFSLPPKNISNTEINKPLGNAQPFNYKGKNFTITAFYKNKTTALIYIEYPSLAGNGRGETIITHPTVCKISIHH